ncbi:uncharacterized protein MKK02DRAFT_19164, partial [Dioszegia hungarica]
DANVVDAATNTVRKGVTVVIENGVFTQVIDSESVTNFTPPDEARTIEMKGLYLCPGLIDCHVHINFSDGRPATGFVDHKLRATYTLKSMLARGFTTVRDVGGADVFQKEAVDQWLTPGPRLFQGGNILSQTGGHGDFRPREAPAHSLCCAPDIDFCTLADGVDGVTLATREMIRKGAQHIKICTSGGVSSPTGESTACSMLMLDKLEGVQFTNEEIQAIVGVTKDMRATLVTAHAYTSEAVRRAVDNGVRGIEHGNLIDRDTAKLLASTGTFLTPTLMISTVKGRAPWNETLPGYMREKNAMVRDAGRRAIQIAEEEGVCVCFGTDLTNGTGYLQSEEFTQRHALVPSHRVIAHATVNGAKQLDDPKLGIIKEGAYGDCLVLVANPLEDCRVLDSGKEGIWGVIKEGRVVVARKEIADQVAVDVVLGVGE